LQILNGYRANIIRGIIVSYEDPGLAKIRKLTIVSKLPKLVLVRGIERLQKLYVRNILVDIQQNRSVGFTLNLVTFYA
jgi:hypothetical protein